MMFSGVVVESFRTCDAGAGWLRTGLQVVFFKSKADRV
ncbi:hypothetical protein BN2497_5701 [Janthinobacterium sp. CG23_2]|nr:hypothetical protein BN2497_5701 [Janthinobacterium sp. CG23_2]CUU29248.1 hypothetical protein BN3177_5701 [Janthinobacterium sp. CG23_2]